MWKDYSVSYMKNNWSSSAAIIAAAIIASLFLSFLCGVFYNLWVYEIERIVMDEGDWQGRISGELDDVDLLTIKNFRNVEKVVINEELSTETNMVADIYFHNARTIYRDMPLLAEHLDLEEDAVSYHLLLLSSYLIHDPQDETPPLLLTFYLVILIFVCISLILVIHNSFAVSMNARVHQFGIFSSIGATPAQIRICLLQEAMALCLLPILLGSLLGTALAHGAIAGMNTMAENMAGRHTAVFRYHPVMFAASILLSLLTVIFSAWIPAWKLSRLTPLESIRNTGSAQLKRKKNSRILALLFGMEGELTGNSLKSQKKALRTSTISLLFSLMVFTMMLCLFALTDLSTKYTYFDKYQDVWDIMVTLNNTRIEDFKSTDRLHAMENIQDCIVYQKAEAIIPIPEEEISEELAALGGPKAVADSSVSSEGSSWLIKAPIVVLDDAAFKKYCEQIGAEFQHGGTIILNQIWDSLHSNFRYREFIPFVKENQRSVILQNAAGEGGSAEIPVLAYTQEVPVLREQYDDYTLVQFIPLSLWKQISAQIGGCEADTLIRALGKEDTSLAELNLLEKNIVQLIGQSHEIESENRIEEKISNDKIITGYKLLIGTFCSLLAMMGIANVFSYTLGFLRQRKREFAQYMSIGLTPAGMRKMFCIEAFVIAGRPILITLPLTAIFVVYLTKASHLKLTEVLPEIPVIQILVFCLAIVGFVALAYYIGGKKVLKYSLAEALRDDTMM